jgi:hypothetical protein
VRHHGFSHSSLYKVTSEQAPRNLLIEFVIAGFGDAINIYEKLRDIEISIRKEREKQNYPDLGDQQIEQLAKYRIDEEWPVSWLYREWKKREQEKNLLARFALPEPP